MYRLLEFLRSISTFLLFVLLEGAALIFYANSDCYTEAKIAKLSSEVTGSVESLFSGVTGYFMLRRENDMLTAEIIKLKRELARLDKYQQELSLQSNSYVDSLGVSYVAARVVKNSINRRRNYILLNRGYGAGVREQMAVVTPRSEIVGCVVACSEGYSVVTSILNTSFSTSGRIAGDMRACEISWNGESRYQVQLKDLSKYANIYDGASVLTTDFSQIFPAGIEIGKIVDFELDESNGTYSANIELATDISALDEVLVVNYSELNEARRMVDDFVEGNMDNVIF